MFNRQTSGSVLCPYCRSLVGVNDKECYTCGRKNPGMGGYAHVLNKLGRDLYFVPLVTFTCVFLFVASLIWDPQGIRGGGLSIISPSLESLFVFGATGAVPVFQTGRWWTVLSATFLHGGILHIGFNLLWLRMLIPPVMNIYGQGRGVLIFTAASIGGFVASSTMGLILPGVPIIGGATFTVGASAALFGLLGALVVAGGAIAWQAKSYAIFLALFGLVFPGVDNWAHAGGFVAGYLAAKFIDTHHKEQTRHTYAALFCIAAFLLSVLVSFLSAFKHFRG